jgi:hypothetical protein
MATGAGRRIHVTGIHLLCVRYSWTPPFPCIERGGAKSCRSDQKADGFPLSGLTPSEAHTDTINPKALLGSILKRDEMRDRKEWRKARNSKYTHELATHRNNGFSTRVTPCSSSQFAKLYLSPASAKVHIYQWHPYSA